LLAIGVTPEVGLAEQLGLKTEGGGVAVDDALCATPKIFCAGDIASHFHPVYNRRLRVEHWQVARKQGGGVARAIVEGPSPYSELPWFWSDQYDTTLNYLGNASDFDQVVWRGQVSDGSYSLFYLRRGVIDAVLSVNDGATGRRSRELIRDRVAVDAKQLADVHIDLRELGKSLYGLVVHRHADFCAVLPDSTICCYEIIIIIGRIKRPILVGTLPCKGGQHGGR
jgi:3-phenylpropionate/trans-cinnamate dioxygenase ferredoxin reductase subunit